MTEEEKRIKLAEAGGWTKFYESWSGQKKACIPNDSQILPLPDYFNDLNAVHELEKVLDEKQQDIMNNTLWDIMSGRKYLWHATATQRAEALGLTLNLWK